MNKNKCWKEVTALFLISIAVFGVAEDSQNSEQVFSKMQEQIIDADIHTEFAQTDVNSQETAEKETESMDASEQETESEDESEQETESENVAPYVEGLAYFCIGEEYGFMDETQTPVFYLDCDSVSNFQEGFAYISVDGKYGYIDQKGEIVIEPVYDDADYFMDGYAKVMKNGKTYLIDTSGQEIIVPGYWEIKKYGDLIGFWDETQGRSGYIENGEVTYFEGSYQFVSFLPEMRQIIVSKVNGAWSVYGVIDFEGNIKIPLENWDITYEKDVNVFRVTDREGKKFFLDGEDFSKVDSIADRTVPEGKKIREIGVTYVSDANRYNKLTPRVSEYLEFLQNGAFSMQTFAGPRRDISLSEWEENDITVKLYDFWQLEKPVLYLWHKQEDSRAAFEGFFALWGEEVICMITADYGGGSGGGEIARLWYDREEDRLLPGITSHYGGGVFGAGGDVYDLIDGECQKKISWETFDYAEPEGGPMTTTYYVNGEETTEEQYEEVDKRYTRVEIIR